LSIENHNNSLTFKGLKPNLKGRKVKRTLIEEGVKDPPLGELTSDGSTNT
jgi:hypothetical protein